MATRTPPFSGVDALGVLGEGISRVGGPPVAESDAFEQPLV